MAKINIFSDFIIAGVLEDNEIDAQIYDYLEKSKQLKKCKQLSNIGGFQTEDITDKIILNKLLLKSQNLLIEHLKFKNLKLNFVLDRAWINENNKHDYNEYHYHPGTDISGIYYTKTCKEGGELIFLRDNKAIEYTNLNMVLDCPDSHTFYKVKPTPKSILLFPSYLTHAVRPSVEDGRVSTAFDLNILTHG
jgi:uncharacterized protein (TIGR02466 family)